jgi:microcin C transport system permease protein
MAEEIAETSVRSSVTSRAQRWWMWVALIVLGGVLARASNPNFALGVILVLAVVLRPLLRWNVNPLTARKFRRFRGIWRGFVSFAAIVVCWFLSLFAEFFVNNRAIVVRYEGRWYFPTFSKVYLTSEFGIQGAGGYEPVNYRELDRRFAEENAGNFVWMPFVPYSPNENLTYGGVLKPQPPSWKDRHFLGTDQTGRDILARLIYGFRIALFFALTYTAFTYLIGIVFGCLMGYFGGWVDLTGQRLIEIWSNIPFLYTVIIIFSVIPPDFKAPIRVTILLVVMVLFSWTTMTYYMRTGTLKERARDYTAAAVVVGASPTRVIFTHILPNTVSTLVTFVPFTISAAITAITALDFLGYGLPPPTPSMGELLKQGRDNITVAPWIVVSAFVSLTLLLTLVTFVGEAIREAFDPKKYAQYV